MSFMEVRPTPLISDETYNHLQEVAPGMDIAALRSQDARASRKAARNADGGMALGGLAMLITAGMIFDKVPDVWKGIWDNARGAQDSVLFFAIPGDALGVSTIAIGLVNRAANEALYRLGFKPAAQSRLNNDLNDFMRSERIPSL